MKNFDPRAELGDDRGGDEPVANLAMKPDLSIFSGVDDVDWGHEEKVEFPVSKLTPDVLIKMLANLGGEA